MQHPTQLPIPEKVMFESVMRPGWSEPRIQAQIETTNMGTIVVFPDRNSTCQPADGEEWKIRANRIIVEKPNFRLVAVECVPEPINLAKVFNSNEEKEQRRQKHEHERKKRPQTGRFVTAEDRERWGEILSKAPAKPKRLHLERHHKAPPPKRGEAVPGLQKRRKKAGKSG